MDTSFTGQADYTLDAKSRLTVPAKYREHFAGGFVLAKDIESCIALWPAEGYADFCEAAIAGTHPMSQDGRKIRAYLTANANHGELDGAGRTAVQPFLAEHAGIDRDVTVVCVGDHLQIWNRERWRAYNERLADDITSITLKFDEIGRSGS